MKKVFLIAAMLFVHSVYANTREMISYLPSDSLFIVGADFSMLRKNQLYTDLERNGRIWSHRENMELSELLKTLELKPEEINSTLFVKYRNEYGSKGEFHLFNLLREPAEIFSRKQATPYLNEKLYRVHKERDLFVAIVGANNIAAGGFTGVKMAVDVSKGKSSRAGDSSQLSQLFKRIPENAGIWGIARPLTRRQAATENADQSTNAVLEAFDHYYFFGVPAPAVMRSHFVGHAKGEAEATFVRTFLIGTLTFAKFKAKDDGLSDALDQINVERNGQNIHVSAIVNKSMVDAYLNGELGIE